MNHLIFEKVIIIFILVLWVFDTFRTRKENVLILPLKRLMPENVINGVISDGVFGSYKW